MGKPSIEVIDEVVYKANDWLSLCLLKSLATVCCETFRWGLDSWGIQCQEKKDQELVFKTHFYCCFTHFLGLNLRLKKRKQLQIAGIFFFLCKLECLLSVLLLQEFMNQRFLRETFLRREFWNIYSIPRARMVVVTRSLLMTQSVRELVPRQFTSPPATLSVWESSSEEHSCCRLGMWWGDCWHPPHPSPLSLY